MIRILFLADSHLGYDLPLRPKVDRRRRGPDFFANFKRALEPAFKGQVDLVLHGGDLFFRSKVAPAIIEQALRPLMELAESGVPVFIVPGNHERSRIPSHLWTAHPNLHIFHEPQTISRDMNGYQLCLSGFPFNRRIGANFARLVEQTGYNENPGDIRLLCMHQSVEGAKVGPSGYTFRPGPDVVSGSQIPPIFQAVLSGHIHRSQKLTHDLRGKPLPAPVIYPGSIERTSFAERHEEKHYVNLYFNQTPGKMTLDTISFVPLPSRPMVILKANERFRDRSQFESWLKSALANLDPDSVVRLDLQTDQSDGALTATPAARIRELAPPSMNVTLRFHDNLRPAQGLNTDPNGIV